MPESPPLQNSSRSNLPSLVWRMLLQSTVAFLLGLLWVYAAHFLRVGLLGDHPGLWTPNGAEYLLGNLIFALQCILLGMAFLAGPIFFRVMYGRNGFLVSFFLSPIFFFLAVVVFVLQQGPPMVGKPVLYLYPPATQHVNVRLDFDGTLATTYPRYNPSLRGWSVTAHPDGTLINDADGKEYSYIFWDGFSKRLAADMREGFVVKGSDTATFLRDALARMGLTPREYNEFIVYWLPKMEGNPYNFIRFLGSGYTDVARLSIAPVPDSVLRVFMVFKPLAAPVAVTPQTFQPFERRGFTAVEWGGSEL